MAREGSSLPFCLASIKKLICYTNCVVYILTYVYEVRSKDDLTKSYLFNSGYVNSNFINLYFETRIICQE